MATISEIEFARICEGIRADRLTIIATNPIGTENETMLWMLLGVLISYLSLDDDETPCFQGRVDESTYRNAIAFALANRRESDFDINKHLDMLVSQI